MLEGRWVGVFLFLFRVSPMPYTADACPFAYARQIFSRSFFIFLSIALQSMFCLSGFKFGSIGSTSESWRLGVVREESPD